MLPTIPSLPPISAKFLSSQHILPYIRCPVVNIILHTNTQYSALFVSSHHHPLTPDFKISSQIGKKFFKGPLYINKVFKKQQLNITSLRNVALFSSDSGFSLELLHSFKASLAQRYTKLM